MPGLKMNLNCPRRLAIYAVFDVLDTMGAEYARTMTGDIQARGAYGRRQTACAAIPCGQHPVSYGSGALSRVAPPRGGARGAKGRTAQAPGSLPKKPALHTRYAATLWPGSIPMPFP